MAVNGVTGYWVRAIVTVSAGAPTPVQSGVVYTVNTPYLTIASTEVGGDIGARMRLLLTDTVGQIQNEIGAIIGTRQTSRGSNFSAYINFVNEQNPTGITVTELIS